MSIIPQLDKVNYTSVKKISPTMCEAYLLADGERE